MLQSNRIAARDADLVYFLQEEVQPRQCQFKDEDGMDVDSEVPIPSLPNVTILVYATPVGDAKEWLSAVEQIRNYCLIVELEMVNIDFRDARVLG